MAFLRHSSCLVIFVSLFFVGIVADEGYTIQSKIKIYFPIDDFFIFCSHIQFCSRGIVTSQLPQFVVLQRFLFVMVSDLYQHERRDMFSRERNQKIIIQEHQIITRCAPRPSLSPILLTANVFELRNSISFCLIVCL